MEDVLLPYPKKAAASTTAAESTLPPASCAETVASVSAEPVPMSAVSHEKIQVCDAWASCSVEESRAFWRSSSPSVAANKQWVESVELLSVVLTAVDSESTPSSNRAVSKQAAESVTDVEMPPITIDNAVNVIESVEMPTVTSTALDNALATSDVGDSSRHSISRSSCDLSEQICVNICRNSVDSAFDDATNNELSRLGASRNAADAGKQETTKSFAAEGENMASRRSTANSRDNAQGTHDKMFCGSVASAIPVSIGSEMEGVECQMEKCSRNVDEFVRDCTDTAAGGSVDRENVLSAAEYDCRDHTECGPSCTVHAGRSISADDYRNVNVSCESECRDNSVDPHCVESDADADTYVRDDTEDSDVDESFSASRPSWQTAAKRDPFPVRERLVLTLEEVNGRTHTHTHTHLFNGPQS